MLCMCFEDMCTVCGYCRHRVGAVSVIVFLHWLDLFLKTCFQIQHGSMKKLPILMYCWSCGPSVNPKACKPSLLHSSDWASEATTSLRLVFHIFTCQLWGCFQGFQQIPIWDLCPTGKGCTLASVWGSLQDIRLQLGGTQPSVPLLPGCLYLPESLWQLLCAGCLLPSSSQFQWIGFLHLCLRCQQHWEFPVHWSWGHGSPVKTSGEKVIEFFGSCCVHQARRFSWAVWHGQATPWSSVLRPWSNIEDTVSWDY